MKWIKAEFDIVTVHGTEHRSGYTSGPFGIHREFSWAVTHLPSGKYVVYKDLLTQAKEVCDDIWDLTDWYQMNIPLAELAVVQQMIRG